MMPTAIEIKIPHCRSGGIARNERGAEPVLRARGEKCVFFSELKEAPPSRQYGGIDIFWAFNLEKKERVAKRLAFKNLTHRSKRVSVSYNEAMMKRDAEAVIRATFGYQAVWQERLLVVAETGAVPLQAPPCGRPSRVRVFKKW
jgi:hypothetical protein